MLDGTKAGGVVKSGGSLAQGDSPSATMPYISVRLLQSVKILPCQSKPVLVKINGSGGSGGCDPLLVEGDTAFEEVTGCQQPIWIHTSYGRR